MGKASNRKRVRKDGAKIEGYSLIGPGVTPYTAEDGAADLIAIEKDRAQFRAAPWLVSYERAPEPGELRAAIPPGCDLVSVHVVKVLPGVRHRIPIFRSLGKHEVN